MKPYLTEQSLMIQTTSRWNYRFFKNTNIDRGYSKLNLVPNEYKYIHIEEKYSPRDRFGRMINRHLDDLLSLIGNESTINTIFGWNKKFLKEDLK
jgi:hypothetical protein